MLLESCLNSQVYSFISLSRKKNLIHGSRSVKSWRSTGTTIGANPNGKWQPPQFSLIRSFPARVDITIKNGCIGLSVCSHLVSVNLPKSNPMKWLKPSANHTLSTIPKPDTGHADSHLHALSAYLFNKMSHCEVETRLQEILRHPDS